MTHSMTRAASAISVALLATLAGGSGASAAAGCSNDAFTVSGAPLDVAICVPPERSNSKAAVVATETLTTGGRASTVRKVALDVVSSDEASHTIDDAPLQGLGIPGTLHMTIGYRAGVVRLEHALLVPGAIALK